MPVIVGLDMPTESDVGRKGSTVHLDAERQESGSARAACGYADALAMTRPCFEITLERGGAEGRSDASPGGTRDGGEGFERDVGPDRRARARRLRVLA
jgi:hypothetical protein